MKSAKPRMKLLVFKLILMQRKTATQLQQEKSELSRSDRLKEVAEKAGLSINDANLRKVK